MMVHHRHFVNVGCPYLYLFKHTQPLVNRVHWIRARGQKHRWNEEFVLTGYEMDWTVWYYLHQAKIWEDRGISAEHVGDLGAMAYAARKVRMWSECAGSANKRFKLINPLYKSLN